MIIEIDRGQKASFYIARVGSLCGQPMRTNYTSDNSFAVISEDMISNVENLYRAAIDAGILDESTMEFFWG